MAAKQEWELPDGSDDPLVLRVVEKLNDGYVSVQTIRRSAPNVIIGRSTMWHGDVSGAGVLVAGPGAANARRRRERVARHTDLLRYAARRAAPSAHGDDVRFEANEIVATVMEDEKVDRDAARAMLRDALGTLGGREILGGYDSGPGYAIPVDRIT